MSGCGVALAIKEALISEDVNGTVVLLGTPGNEVSIISKFLVFMKSLQPRKEAQAKSRF